MGSWFRSNEMSFHSLIMSEEAAPSVIKELGGLGCLQFVDLNPEMTPFQRRYVSFIKRCDEMERKIRYIHTEIKKMEIEVKPAGEVTEFVFKSYSVSDTRGSHLLEQLDKKLSDYEDQLLNLNKFSMTLKGEFETKQEYDEVLRKSRTVFSSAASRIENGTDRDGLDNMVELVGLGNSQGNRTRNHSDEVALMDTEANTSSSRSTSRPDDDLTFSNITGVLKTSDKARFERMVFRATRGNCFIRFSDMIAKFTESDFASSSVGSNNKSNNNKTIFMILFKSATIERKIKKICDAYNANRFDVPDLDHPHLLLKKEQANHKELLDAKLVLDKNTEARFGICLETAQEIETWLWTVRREKAIYHTLNMFQYDLSHHARAKVWVPCERVADVKEAILRAHGTIHSNQIAHFDLVPGRWPMQPTHFVTNKYTYAFQEFVNTYGIPRYREINPSLFTAATFPFLFGVMYGDIGHGTFLALGGLYLILTEKAAEARETGEFMRGIYSGRYMFFAMGLCGVYAGLIYNDFFSLGLNLFGTTYTWKAEEPTAGDTAINNGDIYPFGVDPAWKISENELLFFNSMKMKMSVIIGIIQMTFGICLRGLNSYFEKNYRDIFCEFLPMLLFAGSFFGYMVFLIFYKWSVNWDERMALGSCAYNANGVFGTCSISNGASCYDAQGKSCNVDTPLEQMCPLGYGGTGQGCQPPNLVTTLIGIVLSPGTVDEPMYEGQAGFQGFILAVSFISVPWLLLLKPYLIKKDMDTHSYGPLGHNSIETTNPLLNGDDPNMSADSTTTMIQGDHNDSPDSHSDGEHHDFSEVVIHQAIETIEFVLGMVSNTASYLRLWALSLAHTELASVFWNKSMLPAIESDNPVAIFMGFAVFAMVTTGVLLCMDVLECFLHALRLHWVEFQSKFFKADGKRFQPLDLCSILKAALLD